MEAIAKAKYQKGSPRKARLVIDLIRGKNVSQALAILKFTNKRASGTISKCLNSAIANATYKAERNNIAIDPDDLWVKACFVDMGPTKNRRRLRPAPQGRAYFERRHYCHITIEVSSEGKPEEEEKVYEKRGKKVMAKKLGGEAKAKPEKKEKKAKATEEVKEEKVEVAEETPVTEAVEETVETNTEEVVEEVTKPTEMEENVDENSAKVTEPTEETVEEATADKKPIAAKTDEEATETKPAADKQEEINEELERQ